jgi:hypothetical protein
METPQPENSTSFKSEGIFALLFTKGQCSTPGNHGAWMLSGNCGLPYHFQSIRCRKFKPIPRGSHAKLFTRGIRGCSSATICLICIPSRPSPMSPQSVIS